MTDVALRDAKLRKRFSGSSWSPPRGKRISLESTVVLYLIVDLLIFVASGVVPAALVLHFGLGDPDRIADQFMVVGLTAVLYLLISRAVETYRARQILDRNYAIGRLVLALAATFVILTLVGAATKMTQNFSRLWFFSWVLLAIGLTPLFRFALLAHMRRRLKCGDFVFRALSVGVFAKPLGRADIDAATGGVAQVAQVMHLENLGALESLADWIARAEIDQIYIVTPWVDAPLALERLIHLRQFSTEIFILPSDARVHAHQLGIGVIGDRVALRAADRPINGWNIMAKRAQDVVVASAALLFFAPIMALVALAIKLDSPGPLLFRQKRVGFNGGHFELLKFRSMYADAADAHASRQTSRHDDRVTAVGRFIRRTSLDELPQLINVLRGDMSIVGPRPHALQTRTNGVELSEIADQYAARHRVKPGLTGLAQVNGYRGELDTVEKVQKRVEFDIGYIEKWSTWLDAKIIVRTAALLFFDRKAY
jgi:polysaccharide biosynthesis protein PslA